MRYRTLMVMLPTSVRSEDRSPPLPIVGSGEAVSAAVAQLGGADALLVHVDGKPAGVVTRQDVLGHLAGLAPTVGS